jgi:hypothetical protein
MARAHHGILTELSRRGSSVSRRWRVTCVRLTRHAVIESGVHHRATAGQAAEGWHVCWARAVIWLTALHFLLAWIAQPSTRLSVATRGRVQINVNGDRARPAAWWFIRGVPTTFKIWLPTVDRKTRPHTGESRCTTRSGPNMPSTRQPTMGPRNTFVAAWSRIRVKATSVCSSVAWSASRDSAAAVPSSRSAPLSPWPGIRCCASCGHSPSVTPWPTPVLATRPSLSVRPDFGDHLHPFRQQSPSCRFAICCRSAARARLRVHRCGRWPGTDDLSGITPSRPSPPPTSPSPGRFPLTTSRLSEPIATSTITSFFFRNFNVIDSMSGFRSCPVAAARLARMR